MSERSPFPWTQSHGRVRITIDSPVGMVACDIHNQADADLIAAAHDLLEACKRAKDMIQGFAAELGETRDQANDLHRVLGIIEKAIAKAEPA